MPILTNLPVTSVCGTPVVVTINKAQFVTDFGIVDPYWSNPANWQEIEFYYVDDTGISQVKKMSFAGNTYSLNLKTNIYNGNMECQKVTIMDGNGAVLAFARALFPVASEFDFGVTGGYSAGATFPFTRDFSDPNAVEGNETTLGSGGSFSVTGNNLVMNNVQYPNYSRDLTADGLTLVTGQTYNLRLYVVSASTDGNPSGGYVIGLKTSNGNQNILVPIANIIAAIGSFIDIPLTGYTDGSNNISIGYGSGQFLAQQMTISSYVLSLV